MIGITSFGGYVPRLRLNRMSIVENMGWFAPAIMAVAQGERSFCNWDEDPITMAVAAARDCLTGVDRKKVDALFLGSTTLPFQDRLNSGLVKTVLNLRDDLSAADFTSCQRAGGQALLEALLAVKSGERQNVLVASADQRINKTAYFYEMWYGDAAASLLVGAENVVAEYLGSFSVTHDFVDHYRGLNNPFDYQWEERWVRDVGYSRIIPQAVTGLLQKLNLTMDQVDKLVFPCFFQAEHKAIAKKLGAAGKTLGNLHEVMGEAGAAHPLILLVKALEEAEPGQVIVMASFGQGSDAMAFRVTGAIRDLMPRQGVNGSLAARKVESNYPKFLKFRNLLPTEMGIRAEKPTQTAMTTLWRHRDMLLGMVGGKCTKCGTPQFPRMRICVNPACTAVDSQEPLCFADRPAHVMSFTGDLLAVSVDPPAVYGMVEFDQGGRFMADFTDCEMSQVKVGQPVRLAFRRRYTDKERGFSGYFWKAVPIPQPVEEKKEAKETIRLDGQVAIVTGAGAGLGKAYALELARRGAKVVVNDLGGSRDGSGGGTAAADLVVEEIRKAGGEAVANYDSVATPEGGQAIVDTAIKAFGRVDAVINNAGILRDKTLLKMEPDSWKAVMDVHLNGACHVTRPAFRVMMKQKYGRIIFTTSAAGLYGNFGQTNYSAAKLGLVGFMNTLKLEGERYGVLVNSVAPLAGTRLTEDVMPPDLFKKLAPEFVTPLVVYLASAACKETGMIFNAGMGYFNRAAVITGLGEIAGDGKTPPKLEEIHAKWDEINDLTGGEELPNATAALTPNLEAFDPQGRAAQLAKKAGKAAAPGGGAGTAPQAEAGATDVAGVFQAMPGAFQAGAAKGVEVTFQFSISGPGGGEWNAAVKDGTVTVAEGIHASPTTTIKMKSDDFVRLISGELNAMSAFTGGKLKIEGDLMKSQLIEKLFKF